MIKTTTTRGRITVAALKAGETEYFHKNGHCVYLGYLDGDYVVWEYDYPNHETRFFYYYGTAEEARNRFDVAKHVVNAIY